MKKKIIIISIVVLVLLALGIASYLVFFNKKVITINGKTVTISEKISINTIKALAKADKNIDTKSESIINFGGTEDSPATGDIKLKKGKLYYGYKINNIDYEIEFKEFKEKVIFMKEAQVHCMELHTCTYIYILTEDKNLYMFDEGINNNKYEDLLVEIANSNGDFNEDIEIKKLSSKKIKKAVSDIEKMFSDFEFVRVNKKHKVLAFTKLITDIRVFGGFPFVYTSDKEYRAADNFNNIYDGYIGIIHSYLTSPFNEVDGCESGSRNPNASLVVDCTNGFLLYENNNLSIAGKKLIKNINNELLKYKFIYVFSKVDSLKTDFVIVDDENNVYVSTLDNYYLGTYDFKKINDEVKLYSNSKYVYTEIYNLDTSNTDDDEYGNFVYGTDTYEGNLKIVLYLENNKKITLPTGDITIMVEPKLSEIHSIIYK